MPANIYLAGLSGSGKSTVAPLLAAKLGFTAIDVDRAVENETGRSIADLFAAEGEGGFRDREEATIARLGATGPIVFALGGGALERASTRSLIARAGVLVYLQAPLALLEDRLRSRLHERPLLRVPGALAEQFARRRSYFEAATITVAVDGRTPEGIATIISRIVERREPRCILL